MGYQTAGSVYTIVKQAQTKTTAAAVEDHRQLELDRLDALQAALWPAAMWGRVSAVGAILRIIRHWGACSGSTTASELTARASTAGTTAKGRRP